MSMGPALSCELDARVGIRPFVREPLAREASALLARLEADPPAHLYVPELFLGECANILWKYVRRLGYSAAATHRSMGDLVALPLRRISTSELVADALQIALAHEVTAYDACYVALGDRLGLPLVTADEALVRTLASTPYVARWLGDLPPSANTT